MEPPRDGSPPRGAIGFIGRALGLVRHHAQLTFLVVFVFGLSLYANSVFFVSDEESFRFFPPFLPGVDALSNAHLGAEYYLIARALVEGEGFSNPFAADTGPTAWMAPLYPALLAVLIRLVGSQTLAAEDYFAGIGSEDFWVVTAVIALKNLVLVLTGLTIYHTAKRSKTRLGPNLALFLYACWICSQFWWFFIQLEAYQGKLSPYILELPEWLPWFSPCCERSILSSQCHLCLVMQYWLGYGLSLKRRPGPNKM
jgi:hypothetical protein